MQKNIHKWISESGGTCCYFPTTIDINRIWEDELSLCKIIKRAEEYKLKKGKVDYNI